MQQLGGLDNLMIGADVPNIPMHIAAAMLYDTADAGSGARLFEKLHVLLEGAVRKQLPILRCRLETLPLQLDKAWWVEDPEFDLTHHLTRVALPGARDWQELYQLFGQFHAQALDHNKPQWQLMLVEGLDSVKGIPEGSIAVFSKIHHAMMDGRTAMQMLRSFHSLSPEPDAVPILASMPVVEGASERFRAPPWWMKYGTAWWNSIERPVDLVRNLVKLAPLLWSGDDSPGEKQSAASIPRTRFNHPVAADRVLGHVRMSKRTLKKLQNSHGCTINDLALCTVAGALRHYLQDQGELPEEDLITAMPIDVRGSHKDGDIGNQVSLARVHLHTDVEDIATRLEAIKAATGASKERSRKGDSHALLNIVDDVHPALILYTGQWLLASGFMEKLPSVVNTVITNVPGIHEQAWMFGAKLVDYLGFGPLAPNVGLFHTVSSTPDHINISFASTAEFIGDGKAYRKALERSYREMNRQLG
jgi:diacylglycerol O-acyltransferase